MVTLFFKKNKFLEHYRNILIFKIFFRNFIQVFNFGHFKNVHFQKPNPTFKNFVTTNRYYQLFNLKKNIRN